MNQTFLPGKNNIPKFSKKAIIVLMLLGIVSTSGYYIYIKKSNNNDNNNAPAPLIDKNLDTDNDGLPDEIEKALGTSIDKADTDEDSYTDLQEIKNGYSPLTVDKYAPEEWHIAKVNINNKNPELYKKIFFNETLDTDNDGIPDIVEKAIGTDSAKNDTDNDGMTDLSEIQSGHNPLRAGAEEKYSQEEWLALLEKIENTSREFYDDALE